MCGGWPCVSTRHNYNQIALKYTQHYKAGLHKNISCPRKHPFNPYLLPLSLYLYHLTITVSTILLNRRWWRIGRVLAFRAPDLGLSLVFPFSHKFSVSALATLTTCIFSFSVFSCTTSCDSSNSLLPSLILLNYVSKLNPLTIGLVKSSSEWTRFFNIVVSSTLLRYN